MVIKKTKLLFLLLVLQIFISIIKCQSPVLYTEQNVGNTFYESYPVSSDSLQCQFEFVISATTVNPATTISLSTTSDFYTGSLYTYPGSNSTSAYTTQSFTFSNVPYGSHEFKVISTVDGLPSIDEYSTNFTCVILNHNVLHFEYYQIHSYLRPYLNLEFEAILKVNNLLYEVPNLVAVVQGVGTPVNLVYLGFGYYGYNAPLNVKDQVTPPVSQILLQFPSMVITVDLPTLYNSSLTTFNTTNFVTYPSVLTQQFVELGYKCSPLFSTELVSTSNFFYPLNFLDQLSNIPSPIYGNGDSFVFMGYVPDTNSVGSPETFNFYNYDSLSAPIGSITATITKKQISLLSSTDTSGVILSDFATIGFKNPSKFDFSDFVYKFGKTSSISSFPFGFTQTLPTSFIYEFSFPTNLYQSSINPYTITPYRATQSITIPIAVTPSTTQSTPLISYDINYLYGFNYLITIVVLTPNHLSFIDIDGIKFENDKISKIEDAGVNKQITYSIIVDMLKVPFKVISLVDEFEYWTSYTVGQFYNSNQFIKRPLLIENYNIFQITDISYMYNDIEMQVDQPFSNIIYFNCPGVDVNKPFGLLLMDRVSFNPLVNDTNTYQYYSSWNSTLNKFQIPFIIPANTWTGIVPWSLKFGYLSSFNSTNLSPTAQQLNIVSNKLDAYGPIFKKVLKVVTTQPNHTVGWELTIQDEINGFSYGDITVRGESDFSVFNFHLTPANVILGDKFIGVYNIAIILPLSNICLRQNYVITEVTLVDTQGNIGRFSILNQIDPVLNVFINNLNISDTNKVESLHCTKVDNSPPTLTSFVKDTTSSLLRVVTFKFSAQDLQSGLRTDQKPIVYLSGRQFQTIQCISEIVTFNGTDANYTCSIEIPYGFGFPDRLLSSVYGFINNGGSGSGFSFSDLESLSYGITVPSFVDLDDIIITGSSEIYSTGGNLWITGRGFKPTQQVQINYNIGGKPLFSKISYSTLYPNSIEINSIQPTNNPFYITIESTSYVSNVYKVVPIVIFKQDIPIPTDSSSSSSVSSSASSSDSSTIPNITPSPKRCFGEPECGGPNQGYCNGDGGCICYLPWIGINCTSKVIIVPQPQTNTTNPSIEIPITNDGSDSVLFKSLISIVSLRELNSKFVQVNEYQLDRWIYKKVNTSTNEYNTNILVPSNDSTTTTTTTIKVTLQWFNHTTNITFANEQLTMNPSTIKYTIELSNYKFKSNLNTLQLIMSASFSAPHNNDICSFKEFGENSGDDSNYIKVQIGDRSLYGRFIKRAMINSTNKTIENVLLDSSFNTINSASSIQSFIGINLPNYQSSITIDPDFSVLLDSNDASNNDNSICTYPQPLLTNGQLAGIIVGSFVFSASIVVVSVYFILKKRRHARYMADIQNKLKIRD